MPPAQSLRIRTLAKFNLDEWYSSDQAKRNFGRICQAVNQTDSKVGLLGTANLPLLYLKNLHQADVADVNNIVTIEEAKADWAAITSAAMLNNARFQINGKKVPRAFLYRNEKEDHPALKYRRPQSLEISSITSSLEEVLRELKKLGRTRTRERQQLRTLADRFDLAADMIERRFREVWRASNDFPSSYFAERPTHSQSA